MLNFVNEVEIRYKRKNLKTPVYLKHPSEAIDLLRKYWTKDLDYRETANVIYLSNSHQVLAMQRHTVGSTVGTIYDIKQLLFTALKLNAHALIIAHNHPSGNLTPSTQDIEMTRKVETAFNLVGIKLIDSIILTSDSFTSII